MSVVSRAWLRKGDARGAPREKIENSIKENEEEDSPWTPWNALLSLFSCYISSCVGINGASRVYRFMNAHLRPSMVYLSLEKYPSRSSRL